MRRTFLVGLLVLAIAAIVLVLGTVRAGKDEVAVVSGRVVGPGKLAFALPGTDVRRFALGKHEVAFQSDSLANYAVFDRAGRKLEVAAAMSALVDETYPFLAWSKEPGRRDPREILEDSLRVAVRRYASARSAEELVRGEHTIPFKSPHTHVSLRFFLASAKPRVASVGRRVLLIGVDSMDWEIFPRLLAEGKLPHFAGLVEAGALGPLRSFTPLLSPLIWTTIATGVSPERHGILDFVTRAPDGKLLPVGSRDRRAPALWNLLAPHGKTVSMVAWLATYPAEDIPGTSVTDRFGFLPFAGEAPRDEADPRMVWPPEVLEEALSRRVSPRGLDPAISGGFVKLPSSATAESLEAGYRPGALVNNLLHTLAAAETSRRLATWLWETQDPDLGLYYFEMVDAVGHLFMPYAPPRLPWIDEKAFGIYSDAVEAAYVYQDRILGDFFPLPDSTLLVVVSDHGFKSGPARPREASEIGTAGAARWHTPEGVILLAGPGVKRRFRIEGARVHDVAPTVLAYLGIAPPADMEGRVLTEAFTLSLPVPAARTEGGASEPLAPDSEASTWNNLGLSQLGSGNVEEAIVSFRRALEKDANHVQARNNLANALLQHGDHAEAKALLEAIVAENPRYALGWMNLGLCHLRLGNAGKAVEALERAKDLEPRDPRILRNLGFAELEAEDFVKARDAFAASVDLEETAAGRYGHGMALLRTGDATQGRKELERALVLDPSHEGARKALGQLSP